MAFDQATRNRLQAFVSNARKLLSDEFTQQLQNTYGLDPNTGAIAELLELPSLSPGEQQTAKLLRDTLAHYLSASYEADPYSNTELVIATLDRMVREQAFTVLNRLSALRMAEARDFITESISQGYRSKGFQRYQRIADTALGETGQAYQIYLFSVFDELSLDLATLFDRYSSQGRLFPREPVLLELLELINRPELEALWAEDETVGWIYQYFNSKEERKKMRDESQAPRNSRELAVRNQFFTPRYVVEFLTDNTLGRIWYEMTKGQTALVGGCQYLVRRPNEIFLEADQQPPEIKSEAKRDLSQEEQLQQTVYVQHRRPKDPREIKMLDPACGSMHFGLYAFDLYETIYTEAWDTEESLGGDGSARDMDVGEGEADAHQSLHQSYADKASFLADVPRLIIENNIHGVDIDPRATQIAGLSLWLRAQKSWSQNGVQPNNRPQIQRSNIVCAEPMPGEKALLNEFVSQVQPRVLGELVEEIFDKMQLAGEAGTLLKIEEEIQSAIKEAKSQKDDKSLEVQGGLFGDDKWEVREGKRYYNIDDADDDFWTKAEHLILAELERYAESAAGERSSQKRLFAADAARGFAFIDLCRKRFDVVLMNPPFGDASISIRDYVSNNYGDSKSDIGMCFVSHLSSLLRPNGVLGAITNRVFVANETLAEWRERYFYGERSSVSCFADLGYGVLDDAKVEAAAFVIERKASGNMLVPFLRALDASDKEHAVKKLCRGVEPGEFGAVFYRRVDSFFALPGNVLAYHLPLSITARISSGLTLNALGGRTAVGLQPSDDYRFVRLAWEVDSTRIGQDRTWSYYAKGGEYQPYWDDIHLLVKWSEDGHEIRNFTFPNGKPRSYARSAQLYYEPGVTYPERTTSDLSARVLPAGCIFSGTGQGIFCGAKAKDLGFIVGSYSRAYKLIVDAIFGSGDASSPGSMATHYRSAVLGKLPPPIWGRSEELEELSLAMVQRARELFSSDETSRFFAVPRIAGESLADQVDDEVSNLARNIRQTLNDQAKLEQAVFDELQLDSGEREIVDSIIGPHPSSYSRSDEVDRKKLAEFFSMSESKLIKLAVSELGARRQLTMKSYGANRRYELIAHIMSVNVEQIALVAEECKLRDPDIGRKVSERNFSWLFGIALGRWDVRYALGDIDESVLPDPFERLPSAQPGLLEDGHGQPVTIENIPENYPLNGSAFSNCATDRIDPTTLILSMRDAIRLLWGRGSVFEEDLCEKLGFADLHDYMVKPRGFFSDHLKTYSKSRRQAPIYLPLQVPSGSFSIWLYYHRIDSGTLYGCVNDFVDPKLSYVDETISSLKKKSDRSGSEERELEKLLGLSSELRDFRDELLDLAPSWRPNLDDGVQITTAPLWKLFTHKPWQKKLKKIWHDLERGSHDWSHMAMSFWPDRVIKKCYQDRCVAIAHGLEMDLWEEVEVPASRGNGTKLVWQPKEMTEAELNAYIQQKIAEV